MKARQQSGFTLIELVMVIVILGILAAVAIPQFVDLSGQAEAAAVQGVAGGLSSASSVNYASCSVGGTAPCVSVTTCAGAASTLATALPTGYSIGGTNPAAVLGATGACTVFLTAKPAVTANFVAIRTVATP